MATLTFYRPEACAVHYKLNEWNKNTRIEASVNIPVSRLEEIDVSAWFPDATIRKHVVPFLDTEKLSVDELRKALPWIFTVTDDGAIIYDQKLYTRKTGVSRMVLLLQSPVDHDTRIPGKMGTNYKESMYAVKHTVHGSKKDDSIFLSLALDEDTKSLREVFYSSAFKKVPADDTITYRDRKSSSDLVNHGAWFPKALRISEEVETMQKKLASSSGHPSVQPVARRNVRMEDRDRMSGFSPDHFIHTRSLEHKGVSFLCLPLKRTSSTGVALHSRSFEGEGEWMLPDSKVLIHKTADAWRFVFIFVAILHSERLPSNRLRCLPCYYMIPQYVHRNEVTFSERTIRGIPPKLQQAIWDTKGLSMALHRAFMGLEYEMTQMPSTWAIDWLDMKNSLKVNRHKVLLTGLGRGRRLASDNSSPLEGAVDEGYDGPLAISIHTSHDITLSRARDYLDWHFLGLGENQIKANAGIASSAAKEQMRKVRI